MLLAGRVRLQPDAATSFCELADARLHSRDRNQIDQTVCIIRTSYHDVNVLLTRLMKFLYDGEMGKQRHEDPVMKLIRERVERSGLTFQQIGEMMGYSPSSARQAVSQFLKSGDPQLGMLRRFADAMGISLQTLLKENR
ncbi:MAG: helix-turn-helix transcriptional regulator [Planctomycetes bacterium]|nr:helix-turn-helix transcriptional regulator [Planctomycetota bacterium]